MKVEVVDLRHAYDDAPVLRGVDLVVEDGQVLALLGRNGAGKTTLMSAIAGLLKATAGTISLDGVPQRKRRRDREIQRRIGIASQDLAVYPTLSVLDNIVAFGEVHGLRGAPLRRRAMELADGLGLVGLVDRRVASLSGGERRRVHLAAALVHEPTLALLDEPTAGVDVETRSSILALIREFATSRNVAVVYTTHYLPEVEELGADVAILHEGTIVSQGAMDAVLSTHRSAGLELTFTGRAPTGVAGATVSGDTLHVPCPRPAEQLASVLERLGPDVARLSDVRLLSPTLESVFRGLTSKEG